MSWARLHDGYYTEPETLETSLEALGLHGLALSYCGHHLNDGRLPQSAVVMLARGVDNAKRLSDELVATKMWRREGECFVLVKYLLTNLSAKAVKAERKSARNRMRTLRSRSGNVRPNKPRTNAEVPEWSGVDGVESSLEGKGECEEKGEPRPPTPDEQARGLLDLVNTTAGTHFEPVPANLRLIRARLAEFGDWTLAAMILRQWSTWKAKPEMRPYFRPSTLFNAEKCAQYVGQLTDTDRAWIQRQQKGAAA